MEEDRKERPGRGKNREKIRLLGIDLDGTLLTRNKELTEGCREALLEAVRDGVEVVPVTGRPLRGVPEEVLDVPGIRYVITSNGANTYDLVREKMVRKVHLEHETVRRILAEAPGEDVIREIFIHGWGYHDLHTQKMLEARFSSFPPIMAYINRSRMIVPDFERLLTNERAHVENISLMFPSQEERDACFRRLIRIRTADDKRLLQVLVPWKTDLEITHARADKWLALEDLGNHLGIGPAEIMAIGDGDNDRPMLRGAGLSFAMENAPDFVKETADYLTRDNEHDGAAAAIRWMLERQTLLPE